MWRLPADLTCYRRLNRETLSGHDPLSLDVGHREGRVNHFEANSVREDEAQTSTWMTQIGHDAEARSNSLCGGRICKLVCVEGIYLVEMELEMDETRNYIKTRETRL